MAVPLSQRTSLCGQFWLFSRFSLIILVLPFRAARPERPDSQQARLKPGVKLAMYTALLAACGTLYSCGGRAAAWVHLQHQPPDTGNGTYGTRTHTRTYSRTSRTFLILPLKPLLSASAPALFLSNSAPALSSSFPALSQLFPEASRRSTFSWPQRWG